MGRKMVYVDISIDKPLRGGSRAQNINILLNLLCFSVFIYMSAGCISIFRTCVQVYLEIHVYILSSCFSPSLHVL